VVEIFPVLDADQIRHFGRIIQTAIPASEAAATQEGRSQLTVFSFCEGLEALVDLVLAPRYAKRLISPHPERLGACEKRRINSIHHAVCRVH
jgi:hypothetical protein